MARPPLKHAHSVDSDMHPKDLKLKGRGHTKSYLPALSSVYYIICAMIYIMVKRVTLSTWSKMKTLRTSSMITVAYD